MTCKHAGKHTAYPRIAGSQEVRGEAVPLAADLVGIRGSGPSTRARQLRSVRTVVHLRPRGARGAHGTDDDLAPNEVDTPGPKLKDVFPSPDTNAMTKRAVLWMVGLVSFGFTYVAAVNVKEVSGTVLGPVHLLQRHVGLHEVVRQRVQ